MASKHMKRCSTSLIIREMQIKTKMRYHFTQVKMTIIKKSTNNKCWRGSGVESTISKSFVGGEVKKKIEKSFVVASGMEVTFSECIAKCFMC